MTIDDIRQRLASADALLPLAIVGVASGLVTALIIIAFRMLTESAPAVVGLMDDPEGFETLPPWLRFALPVAGGALIGAIFTYASLGSRQVGVVHVMERLAAHAGRLPWRNAVLQFLGGALAIVTGHSVGREGPVIHVGAASSSLLGQWCGLPHNSLRILVACGTAGSIAASFNTPIAGVIFAMEVVLMEYTLLGFTPVILAAVTATSVSRLFYGSAPAFDVPAVEIATLLELPYVVLLGTICGAIAAALIHSIELLDRRCRDHPLWMRTTLAGVAVGLCALAVPEVMGIGYDTVELALLGNLALGTLIAIAAAKLFATIACISFGIPGGIIGPTVVIGAAIGGALGIVGHAQFPDHSADAALYALLGMGAMMGATLQAPLAALMAVLELTANSNVILPGMLAVVSATLTTRVLFKKDSVFVTILRARGLEYRHDPVAVALERTGVAAVMDRRFVSLDLGAERSRLTDILASDSDWVVVTRDRTPITVIRAADLAKRIEEADRAAGPEHPSATNLLNLMEAHRNAAVSTPDIIAVSLRATLREALDRLDETGARCVLVTRNGAVAQAPVHGVLTRSRIERSVRFGC